MKNTKQIFPLLGLSLALFACDAGDLTFDKLNFDNVTIKNCETIYYKMSKNELLLVNLNNGLGQIALDTLTPIGETRSIPVSNTNNIVYRTYSDNISDQVICNLIPPAQPVVISEYVSALGGKINYTPVVETGFVNNRATINYLFQVTFQNIMLTNGSNNIKYESYNFGTILYKSNALNFVFTQPVSYCDNEVRFLNNLSQASNGIVSNELIFKKSNILSETTQAGEKSFPLSNDNYLEYLLYNGNLTDQEPCEIKGNTVRELWKATEGSLIVTTVVSPINGAVQRTFTLKNVIFKKDNHQFFIENLDIKTE
ncbi:hypothetical protein AB4865_12265 [Capnocytophaga sp. ARDL2]|uniref:hypothetical protein n=1 Tax=Capnocytophaga sp. ARDL2 TaxID=3238809 RepID=UPI003555CEEE